MTKSLRVLLTTDAVGGVWRYTVDLVGALDRAGVSCLVVGAGPEPDAARIRECDWRRSELVWTRHALDWTGEASDDVGIDLAHRARAWSADIVHLHLASQAAGLPRDLAVVAVCHSCQPTWWRAAGDGPMPASWQPILERTRRGLARADRVLAPTRAHADAIARTYGAAQRITVVANAVASQPASAQKEPFVLAAGRWWDAGKNGHALDRASASITWPVRMAGPTAGPDGSSFHAAHASTLGELPNRDINDLMSRASIFVSPSLYEPFGLAVLEAAAHGCALVLADIPTFRELWDGAARFADPHDPEAFAFAIGALSNDADARARLAAAARTAARPFTPERQRDAILAAWRGCLEVAA